MALSCRIKRTHPIPVARLILAVAAVSALAGAGTKPVELQKQAEQGSKLTDEQAKQLRVSLPKSPEDPAPRAQLLGYFYHRKDVDKRDRTKLVLWMIDHEPTDPFVFSQYCLIDPAENPDAYLEAKTEWDHQLGAHSNDAAICANGAMFRAKKDFAEADSLLQQAIALEPKNALWSERLAVLCENRMATEPGEASKLATRAVQLRQTAFNLTQDPPYRFHVLIPMADDAVVAEDFIAAKRLAKQLVGTASKFRDSPEYGDAIHRGNIVQGLAALQAGNVERAVEYLNDAGQTPGSTTLAADGPDLRLAKKLLAKGERTAVRDYLIHCGTFWKAGGQRLKAWIATLDAGGTPDFQ